jgi:hypothetical protein
MANLIEILESGEIPPVNLNIKIEKESILQIAGYLALGGTLSLGVTVFVYWILMTRFTKT